MRMAARPVKLAQVKRSKYRAVPVVVDGVRFASTREAERYAELTLLEKSGAIRDLVLQPRFELHAPQLDDEGMPRPIECLGCYRGDFAYQVKYVVTVEGIRTEHWRGVVEDVKGFRTPLYRWKKKHVEAQYGITVQEIR